MNQVLPENSDREEAIETSSSDSSVFLINSVHKVSQVEDLGNKILLKLQIHGQTVEVLLDTVSPISIMPKDKMREIFPVEKLNLPKDNRFVDINKNPINMSSRF